MKPILTVGLCVAFASVPALGWAQGPTTPDYVRKHQGGSAVASQVTCDTSDPNVLFDGNGDRRAWSLLNTGSVSVYVCCDSTFTETPTATATPAPCATSTAGIVLTTSLPAYTNETSAKGRCRCITGSSSATVVVQEWK